MQVIKQVGHFFLVKIGRKYHTVAHEPWTNKTWTVNRTDGDVRVADGWTAKAVQEVSKGRAKNTANIYFYQTIARFKAEQRKLWSKEESAV